MDDTRVILVTVAGPSGHVDVGVRSDATPADLAWHLGTVIGVNPAGAVVEHWSPPRPGGARERRRMLGPAVSLADADVLDGDMVVFFASTGPAVAGEWGARSGAT